MELKNATLADYGIPWDKVASRWQSFGHWSVVSLRGGGGIEVAGNGAGVTAKLVASVCDCADEAGSPHPPVPCPTASAAAAAAASSAA